MKKLKNTTPLCFLSCGKLVCYKEGNILILNDGSVERIFPVFQMKKERLFGKFRYLFRFFRMGIRAAIAIDDESIIISAGDMLYELNIKTEHLSSGYFCGEGIRPLIFTEVKDINNFDDGIYFGGYLGNRAKKPVHIYKRVAIDKWVIVYTFPHGAINHVHAIVADKYRDCLWIYTGDFDESAAIWRVTDNFKKVECYVCNDQKYRGCIAFALPEGLLYATDAPFADNYIYLLELNSHELKQLVPLDGSCIYGTRWNAKYVFSSTVECDGRNTTRWQAMFSKKRGAGIKNEYVHMYVGNIQDGFQEIYKEKKDWLPYCSFQFGVIRFPYGDNKCKYFYFQPVATAKNDLNLMSIID